MFPTHINKFVWAYKEHISHICFCGWVHKFSVTGAVGSDVIIELTKYWDIDVTRNCCLNKEGFVNFVLNFMVILFKSYFTWLISPMESDPTLLVIKMSISNSKIENTRCVAYVLVQIWSRESFLISLYIGTLSNVKPLRIHG